MNTKTLTLIAAAVFAARLLHAAEPEANGDTKAGAKPERYQLKKRSACNLDATVRPPFWPIGWVHHEGPHQEIQMGPRYVLEEKNFSVTSILLGPPAIAFINGRAYEEGQFLRMPKAAALAATPSAAPAAAAPALAGPRIRVQRIADGQVWLAYEAQIIAVPLKRPELNERKGTQELLNEEKDDDTPAPAVSKR